MTLKDHLANNLCLNINVSVDEGGERCLLICPFAERSCTSWKIPVTERKKNCLCCSYQKPFELGQVFPDTGRQGVRRKSWVGWRYRGAWVATLCAGEWDVWMDSHV